LIVEWKKLYEDSTKNCEKIEQSLNVEIEKLTVHHQKTVGDLQCKLSSVNEQVKSLESQLSKSNNDARSSRTREEALHLQMRKLLDELQETRRSSPNATMRQINALLTQIRMLDLRQKGREDKLNKVVAASTDEYVKAEINSLHKMISDKNLIISKFQCELDAILHVLETLQEPSRLQ